MAQYRGYPWRFIFTDLGSKTTTWADGLLTNRKLSFTVDQAATIDAAVWPDDRRVNELFTDNYPLVAQTNRLIYAFRRDNPLLLGDGHPWQCRAAGILMSPEDEGDPDVPLTHVHAWDPWMFMGARPCQLPDGNLGGPNGINWYAVGGHEIILQLLKNSIDNNAAVNGIGNGTFIDAGPDWGGTAFWGGTIEATPSLSFTASQGMSVADAWTQLCATNLDIVLTPIYDPVFRPGYTHELSIYQLSGKPRPNAVFGWDMMNRCLKKIDRVHDGTPGSFFNLAQYFVGQGGFPIPSTGPITAGDSSVADFGRWWSQVFVPNQTLATADPSGNVAFALAKQAIQMAKQGKRTLTLDPIPERAPIPLLDYTIGDRVQVWASKKLRVAVGTSLSDNLGFRVETIPIDISDDGIETVSSLVVSPDYRKVEPPPGNGRIATSLIAVQAADVVRTRTHSRLGSP